MCCHDTGAAFAEKYSGRLSLRIPPEVHRGIVINAAESGISVNRWINLKLI